VAIYNTIVWDNQENIDNKFIISFATSSPVGTTMRRDAVESIPHSYEARDFHPTLNNIIKGGVNDLLAAGAVTVSFDWSNEDNPPSASDIDAYVSFIQSEESEHGMTVENIIRTPDSLKFDFVANKEQTEGPYSVFKYMPKSNSAEYRIRDEGTYMACVLRLGDSADDWNFTEYSVAAGDRVTINKQGTECYLLICSPSFIIGSTEVMVRSTPMYIGGNPLEDKSLKKLQSSNVNLFNSGTTAARIGMLYK
jgi:hypothetical protein